MQFLISFWPYSLIRFFSILLTKTKTPRNRNRWRYIEKNYSQDEEDDEI
jgi:hypothetical protein